jgi:hypothetical protein
MKADRTCDDVLDKSDIYAFSPFEGRVWANDGKHLISVRLPECLAKARFRLKSCATNPVGMAQCAETPDRTFPVHRWARTRVGKHRRIEPLRSFPDIIRKAA